MVGMRSAMSSRRLALALLAAVAATLVAAPAASAKEGVKATLTAKIPLNAAAGIHLKVAWQLWTVDATGQHEPFGAGDVFIRLRSAARGQPEEAFASVPATGDYEATVVVPEGGIGGIEIGLRGFASGPTGRRRSDVLFPITNDPVSTAAPSPVADSNGRVASTMILGAAAPLALAALVGALVARKQRRRATSPPLINA